MGKDHPDASTRSNAAAGSTRKRSFEFEIMGWDAFSSATNYWIKNSTTISKKNMRKDFKEASDYVGEICEWVDGGLENGLLDLSRCAYMIEELTGRSAWDENPWGPEFVKKMYNKITQHEVIDDTTDRKSAYWSVRKFFEVCAKYNLSIRFSW